MAAKKNIISDNKSARKLTAASSFRKNKKASSAGKKVAEVGKKHAGREVAPETKKQALSAREKHEFTELLLALRERTSGQIATLKSDSLTRQDSVNSEEDGTDAFDRQFALSLVTSEHDSLFDIDTALRRIEEGTYGICEQCENIIEKPRLKALPFVRTCVSCQSEMEKGKPRYIPSSEPEQQ